MPEDTPGELRVVGFQDTPWFLVCHSSDAAVLNELLKLYWKPLYFFVRRRGYDYHESKDIVQEFLTRLFERSAFKQADPARGRFRTWLLASLINFLSDRKKSNMRAKRGSGKVPLSLDFEEGEVEYKLEIPVDCSPEETLDRAWARNLLESAIRSLKADPCRIAALRMRMDDRSYEEIAVETGMDPAKAKASTHRLRAQLRLFLESRIRATVADEEGFQAELRCFLSLISVTDSSRRRR